MLHNIRQVQGWCHPGHFLWKVLCGEQRWISCPHHSQVIESLVNFSDSQAMPEWDVEQNEWQIFRDVCEQQQDSGCLLCMQVFAIKWPQTI